jgi:hypothetical protein
MQIQYLAAQEQRSIAEQTIILLKESLNNSNRNKSRRRMVLKKMEDLTIPDVLIPDPVTLLREDRER